jgi:hypothetical protein
MDQQQHGELNMSTAIVRLKETKEIVGFYAHEDSLDLFAMVDEVTDPYACEYMSIIYGGFHWPNSEAAIIFSDEYLASDGDMETPSFNGAEMSEGLFNELLSNDEWIPFTEKDSYLFTEEE